MSAYDEIVFSYMGIPFFSLRISAPRKGKEKGNRRPFKFANVFYFALRTYAGAACVGVRGGEGKGLSVLKQQRRRRDVFVCSVKERIRKQVISIIDQEGVRFFPCNGYIVSRVRKKELFLARRP